MEQLQQAMKFLRQYGFWIVCVLATLGTAGVWYWGAGILTEETDSKRNKLKGRINQINTIATTTPHPNKDSQDALTSLITEREQKLYTAWEMLTSTQDGTLEWDEKYQQEYPAAFDQVSAMQPIESFKDVKVDKSFRTLYRDYHRELFEPLAEKIGAKWSPSGSGDPAAGGMNRDLGDVLVDWDPKNQANLLSEHFSWFDQDGGIPSTMQMLYAQEDYWVLDSIVETIKRTNGDIDSRHKAAIKTITYIKLGNNVEPRSGAVKIKTADGIVTEETQIVADETARAPRGRGRGREVEVAQVVNPAENRYVDLEYSPLSATKLESSMKGANVNDARISVAKRMPIQMRLLINQTKINRFFVECGNSDLPVEIRQVRMGKFGKASADQFVGGNDADLSKADVTVEIYGIVYIFNPANKELLNIKEPSNAATAAN